MKRKGFTLIEVLVAIVLSAMLITVMAGMLLFGQKSFENSYSEKKHMQDYLVFKKMLDNHLSKMVGPGFQLVGGSPANIGFDNWGGTWSNKVRDGVVFYSAVGDPANPAKSIIIKGEYRFNSSDNTIRYSEWIINQNAALDPNFNTHTGNTLENVIVLTDVSRFQVTDRYNSDDAYDFKYFNNDPVRNYLRIFIELDTNDKYKNVRYSFTEDYINKSVSRTIFANPLGTATKGAGGVNSDVIMQDSPK